MEKEALGLSEAVVGEKPSCSSTKTSEDEDDGESSVRVSEEVERD